MPKAKTKKEAKRSYNAFVLNKHKYNIGDPILVQSKAANPFIGEILKIEASPSDSKNVTLSLRWYYRPEEIAGGRREYHGKDEIIQSDHVDKCHVQCVNGPCKVIGIEEYIENGPDSSDEVFYQREVYDSKKGQIKTKLPLFCICKKPQNPDVTMIFCDACEDWFHLDCVKISKEELEKKSYICPSCRNKGIKVV